MSSCDIALLLCATCSSPCSATSHPPRHKAKQRERNRIQQLWLYRLECGMARAGWTHSVFKRRICDRRKSAVSVLPQNRESRSFYSTLIGSTSTRHPNGNKNPSNNSCACVPLTRICQRYSLRNLCTKHGAGPTNSTSLNPNWRMR